MFCMRRTVLVCLLLTSISLAGQEVPRVEVFGGYSYLHVDTNGASASSLNQLCSTLTLGNCPFMFQVHPNFNGWNAAAQINLSPWLGVKADFSGHYGNLVTATSTSASFQGVQLFNFSTPSQANYDLAFGPVLSYRKHNYSLFFEGLIGDEHQTFSSVQLPAGLGSFAGPSSRDYFAIITGGGIEVRAGKRLRIRPAEVDYVFVKNSSTSVGHQNNFRVSAGLVFTFGRL